MQSKEGFETKIDSEGKTIFSLQENLNNLCINTIFNGWGHNKLDFIFKGQK